MAFLSLKKGYGWEAIFTVFKELADPKELPFFYAIFFMLSL